MSKNTSLSHRYNLISVFHIAVEDWILAHSCLATASLLASSKDFDWPFQSLFQGSGIPPNHSESHYPQMESSG